MAADIYHAGDISKRCPRISSIPESSTISPWCSGLAADRSGRLANLLVGGTVATQPLCALLHPRSNRIPVTNTSCQAHGHRCRWWWPFPHMYRSARGANRELWIRTCSTRPSTWAGPNGLTSCYAHAAHGWSSIASGTVLAFARALGEFGCTLFLAVNQLGSTRTIPIAIYFEWMNGNTECHLVLDDRAFGVQLPRHFVHQPMEPAYHALSPEEQPRGAHRPSRGETALRGGGRRRATKGLR